MTVTPYAIGAWPAKLASWSGGASMPGSPERQLITLRGRVNLGDVAFSIGEARDALGTLIRLAPEFPTFPKPEKKPEPRVAPESAPVSKAASNSQQWRQLWAKVAVRSGYLHPGIDPEAYRSLCELRRLDHRVELIFDTSELISGAGHWLVRFFGERVDVVSTVISQREVHGWRDSWKGKPVPDFKALEHRANYLAATRFVERLPHTHPIWRTLDVLDEGALLLADGSAKGGKSPNADTLLFRAAKRYILDQVPNLRRFFVTGDVAVARAAAHVLPPGSLVTTWVSELKEGTVLCPLHWWSHGSEYGCGVLSDLAKFVLESLAVCAEVELHRPDGALMLVRLYEPGRNESPATWRAPIVWVETRDPQHPTGAPLSAKPSTLPPVKASLVDPAVPSSPPASRTAEPGAVAPPSKPRTLRVSAPSPSDPLMGADWPLHFAPEPKAKRISSGARLTARMVLEGVSEVMIAARDGKALTPRVSEIEGVQERALRRLLSEGLALIDVDGTVAARGTLLPGIFAKGDVDALSSLLSISEPLGEALDLLQEARSARRFAESQPRDRKLETAVSLARALGLAAVSDNGAVVYGAKNPNRNELLAWLRRTLVDESRREPLGEVPVSNVARRALTELEISPARFERGLAILLRDEHRLVGKEGASESRVLMETVVQLSADGVRWIELSADGLCGLRALAWRGP